jgi:hypothetical protein
VSRLLIKLLAVCLFSGASLSAEAEGPLIRPGPRPAMHVFDPSALIPGAEAALGRELERIRKTEFIDVLVVVLPDLGGAAPDDVARRFAGAWADAAAHCIVLYVPGQSGSPWISPGGRVVENLAQEVLDPAIAAASNRAGRNGGAGRIVEAAATEAVDLMRLFVGGAADMEEVTPTRQAMARMDWDHVLRRRQVFLITGIGSGLPVLLGLALLFVNRRKRERRFPPIHWHRRLGAPHGGGNHLSLTLPPAPPAGSR